MGMATVLPELSFPLFAQGCQRLLLLRFLVDVPDVDRHNILQPAGARF